MIVFACNRGCCIPFYGNARESSGKLRERTELLGETIGELRERTELLPETIGELRELNLKLREIPELLQKS